MQTKLPDSNPKTQILFDANLTNREEIEQFWECINRLAEGNFKNTKKLQDTSYYGNPVYRAKANHSDRVAFTFTPTLCILATTHHKYKQLKRRFAAKKGPKSEIPELEILELPEKAADILPKTGELQFTAAVPYKKGMLEWDEVQREAHSQQKGSVIFRGFPGAGKTLVVYHSLLRYLSNLPEPDPAKPQDEILFVAPSGLIKNLLVEYEKSGLKFKVRFICWDDFLALDFPIGTKPTSENDFKSWLASLKEESWLKNHDSGEIHYELSLIAALGSDEYFKLGKRQSYFARINHIQTKLISILAKWQQHLQNLQTFDPMISVPKVKPVFLKKFMDETQNLPPTALAYLVGLPGDCLASLDSEQCLDSSPFIDNFLKGLFNLRYGKEYKEFLLEDSYRNPPEVFAVGASILQFKRKRDTIGYRQVNKNAQSKRPKNSGLVSLIDKKHQVELKPTCSSATTVVVVIANVVSDLLREAIKKELNCNNIITARDVIGLEFENVVLYEPISQSSIKGCAGDTVGISLRQLKDLCAVYVAVTRSEKNVYILDDVALKRWPKLVEELFGKLLPLNVLAQSEIKSSNKDFEALALNYYEKGQIGNAKEILRFNLQYDEAKIQEFFANTRAKASPVVPAIPKEPENIPAKADSIPQIPKMEIHPNPKTTLLKQVNDYFDKKQPEEAVKIMQNQLGYSEGMIQTILKSKGFPSAPPQKTPLAKTESQKKDVFKLNTILMTEEQIQRAQRLWANFTKKNIQTELAKPDCAIILFEAPLKLFFLCLKDSKKWKILKSVIEEVNAEVAEKLLSVISTKNITAVNLVGCKPTEEVSLIKYFMLKEISKVKKTLIHNLFEKLSPNQKVAFLVDSLAYSRLTDTNDNACFSADQRTFPLIPDAGAIKKDSKALVSLLCKPMKYFNCSNYAAALAGLDLGASLMINLIEEVELFNFIAENLYKIDAFESVAITSIFEGLCSHNSGLYLLNMLYEREPTLKSKITIGHLLSFFNGKPPILFSLYQNPLAHPILNEITTNDLAAKYPHGLPDSQVYLLLLTSSEDGIKVIQKMMDAQPSIVKLMTGTVLSVPGFNKCSMLPLLSSFDVGVLILHQLLDVHGGNLVKEIGYALINNPVTPHSQMTAYKLLQNSKEGKRFLERLRSFGWTPPTTENPYGFFATQDPLESSDLLLHYIASENTEMVQKIVRANPYLLLKIGRIEKNGVVYEIQPIEYCQMHGDCIRLKAIVDCLEESEQGRNVKNIVFSCQNPFKYA